ncbi:MAG: twin-arginine translocation pathway signal [Candidatus Sericytochromatia bacterium]
MTEKETGIDEFDETAAVEPAQADDEVPPSRLTRLRGIARRVQGGRAAWVGGVAASVALVAALAYFVFWPDRQTDEDAERAVVAAASQGTTAVYSYGSTSIDRDIAAAKSHLTGDLLKQYEGDTAAAVAASVKQKAMKTNATVVGAAVSGRLRPDTADVLLFLNQTTTSLDSPGPSMTATRLMVTLSKVDGRWLISSLKPV